MIIDSQVHVWPPDRADRRLLAGVGDRKPYSYEQLVVDMDGAGVDRAILMPPSFDADRNDYALEAVQEFSRPLRSDGPRAAQDNCGARLSETMARPARHVGHAAAVPPQCGSALGDRRHRRLVTAIISGFE
jgi:predicted TIM-barrel fold metal-dependent hydrolase